MLQRLRATDIGPFRALDLTVASRLNVFTGDNGLGKTLILGLIWAGCGAGWRGLTLLPHGAALRPSGRFGLPRSSSILTYSFDHGDNRRFAVNPRTGGLDRSDAVVAGDVADRALSRSHTGDGVVVYARVDGGFSVWDQRINGDGGPSASDSSGEPPPPRTYEFSPSEVWTGLEERVPDGDNRPARTLCKGLHRDWVEWQVRKNAQFEQLCEAMRALSEDGAEALRPGEPVLEGLVDTQEVPTLALPYGSVPVTRASAGMRRILSLAYMLVWAWGRHCAASEKIGDDRVGPLTLLIDEVEAHLHPKWQRQVLPALLAVCKSLAPGVHVQIFATTHAPLVLASLEPEFDPSQDAIFDLELQTDAVEVSVLPWRRRGEAGSWLTEVFDLKVPRSRPAEQALVAFREEVERGPVSDDRLRELIDGLRAVVPDTDPILAQWAWYAEKKGVRL